MREGRVRRLRVPADRGSCLAAGDSSGLPPVWDLANAATPAIRCHRRVAWPGGQWCPTGILSSDDMASPGGF